MFVWAELPDGIDAQTVLPVALAHDVAFVPGAPFFPGAPRLDTLRLSFTTYGPDATYDNVLETAPETLAGKVEVGDPFEVS